MLRIIEKDGVVIKVHSSGKANVNEALWPSLIMWTNIISTRRFLELGIKPYSDNPQVDTLSFNLRFKAAGQDIKIGRLGTRTVDVRDDSPSRWPGGTAFGRSELGSGSQDRPVIVRLASA